VRCSALQCVAGRCSVLQCVALASLAASTVRLQCVAMFYTVLQCVAVAILAKMFGSPIGSRCMFDQVLSHSQMSCVTHMNESS